MTKLNNKFEDNLKPTFFMDYHHLLIQEKVRELTEGIPQDDDIGKAIKIFYFVRDQIKYSVKNARKSYKKANWKSSMTLKRGFGFCIPKSILLASLARSIGIPSRLHFVDIINHMTSEKLKKDMGSNIFVFHGFVELYLGGRWIEANCAFDKELCHRKNYPVVNFDGKRDGLFASTNKDGKPFVDYIKDRGIYNDAPHQEIMRVWAKEYPGRYTNNGKPIN